MVASVYKWLSISAFLAFMNFADPAHTRVSHQFPASVLHPYYVSVTEINHNAIDKTLEISCKLFTDDFEKALADKYKMKVDLSAPRDKKIMDKIITDYIKNHLAIKADGKNVNLNYLGFEKEDEAVFSYFQVENLVSVKRIDVTNSILHEEHDTQINIMHVSVGGNRKSTKLDYPNTQAVFNF
jgi:hypothetical protein